MQVAGDVLAACSAGLAFADMGEMRRDDGRSMWMVFLLLLGLGRALALRGAGTRLVYGDRTLGVPGPACPITPDERRFSGVMRYLIVAGVHTLLVVAVAVGIWNASACSLAPLLLALIAWPAALAAIVRRPALAALGTRLPAGPDKSFEAVAILMTAFACVGLALGVCALVPLFDVPASEGAVLVLIVCVGILVVRALLHLRAGLAGLRETSIERAVAHATSYANTATVIAIGGGGAVAVSELLTGHGTVLDFALIGANTWILAAWPVALRRFFRDRHFDGMLAEATPHHRAPDAGLTGLGWLIAGHAAVSAVWLVSRVAVAQIPQLAGPLLGAAMPGTSDGDLAWQLLAAALGAWAACELVCMTTRARGAVLAWALASAGIAVHLLAPDLALPELPREHLVGLAWLVATLVLAGVAAALVLRDATPAARARYRRARPAP